MLRCDYIHVLLLFFGINKTAFRSKSTFKWLEPFNKLEKNNSDQSCFFTSRFRSEWNRICFFFRKSASWKTSSDIYDKKSSKFVRINSLKQYLNSNLLFSSIFCGFGYLHTQRKSNQNMKKKLLHSSAWNRRDAKNMFSYLRFEIARWFFFPYIHKWIC